MIHFFGHEGDWGPEEICPGSHDFVTQFQVMSDPGSTIDNSAMNGLRLICDSGAHITSNEGPFGSYAAASAPCPSGYDGVKVQMADEDVSLPCKMTFGSDSLPH